MTPKLRRAGYARYQIADGPAAGTIIERSSNPDALPCRQWAAIEGPMAFHCVNDGFTLRGLAAALTRSEPSAEDFYTDGGLTLADW